MKLSAMTALALTAICISSGAFAGEEGTVQVTEYTMKDIDGSLVGKDGKVIDRFEPRVLPDDPAVISAIEAAIAAR